MLGPGMDGRLLSHADGSRVRGPKGSVWSSVQVPLLGEREGGGEGDGPVQAVHASGEHLVGDRSVREGRADHARELLEGHGDRAEVPDRAAR